MRALVYASNKKQDVHSFKLQDISEAIFNNKFPVLICYPFKLFNNNILAHLPVTFHVHITDQEITIIELLEKSVYKIGHTRVTVDYIKTLYPWALALLVKELYIGIDSWRDFFISNIDKVCELSYSILQWQCIQHAGVQSVFTETPLKFEQRYWISNNAIKDRNKLYEYVENVRESLLPWLNTEMYKNYAKRKETLRENSTYEQTRSRLLAQANALQVYTERTYKGVTAESQKPREIVSAQDLDDIR